MSHIVSSSNNKHLNLQAMDFRELSAVVSISPQLTEAQKSHIKEILSGIRNLPEAGTRPIHINIHLGNKIVLKKTKKKTARIFESKKKTEKQESKKVVDNSKNSTISVESNQSSGLGSLFMSYLMDKAYETISPAFGVHIGTNLSVNKRSTKRGMYGDHLLLIPDTNPRRKKR